MRFVNKLFKKDIDERQEKELLQVEHKGFWLMYWLLFASIMIQIFFGEFQAIMGEWIVFMLVCIYTLWVCIRKGVWSRGTSTSRLGMKYYLLWSTVGSLCTGVPLGLFIFYKGGMNLKTLWIIPIEVLFIFILLFVSFIITGSLAKKSEKKRIEEMEKEMEEEEDE